MNLNKTNNLILLPRRALITSATIIFTDIGHNRTRRPKQFNHIFRTKMKQSQDIYTRDNSGTFIYKVVCVPSINMLDLMKG